MLSCVTKTETIHFAGYLMCDGKHANVISLIPDRIVLTGFAIFVIAIAVTENRSDSIRVGALL